MNTKYAFHPRDFELGQTEKFYADMAAKGWHLTRRGRYLSVFQKQAPQKTRYRVELTQRRLLEDGELPQTQREPYEERGWEYVTGRDMVHVFRAPDGVSLPEVYSEPALQAETYKGLMRGLIWDVLSLPIGVIVGLLFLALLLRGTGGSMEAALLRRFVTFIQAPTLPMAYGAVLLWSLFNSVWGLVHLTLLKRRMKQGESLDHTPRKRRLGAAIVSSAILTVAVILLCMSVLQLFLIHTGPMPTESGDAYLLLADLGLGSDRTEGPSDELSQVTHSESVLAEFWDTREFVKYGGRVYWLYQEVYRLKVPSMADLMARGLVARTHGSTLEGAKELQIPGMDRAWQVSGTFFVAIRGNMVMSVSILSDDAEGQIPEALALLAARWAEK